MIDNRMLSKCFFFADFQFTKTHYTDKRRGINYHFLALMKKGTAQIVSANKKIQLQPGDLFFIPMGLAYQSYWQGSPEIAWDAYGFKCFPDRDGYEYELQKVQYGSADVEILQELSRDHTVNCTTVGKLYTLLGSVLPHMVCKTATPGSLLLQRAVGVMEENPLISVPEIAEKCGVSVSGLYAAFRREIGHTPVDHRHLLMCRKATELLTHTDTDIETISELCGFSSSSYFRKILYRVTGKTPSAIRKNSVII